ncbi:MAG: cupin domain-containing protein [Candidatus Omnitrophica bacterium]|nr:cupin domain-containing protein [Candidatus Omnitrophota bacterium]
MNQPFDIVNLAETIAYQDNAVVSQTLIKKEKGTVTIFAFDQDQGLSEHTAPFDAMLNVIEGKAEVTIASTTQTLKKGEMVIMPADIPHAVKAVERFKMMLIMIKS